jgi:hypothetical protein
MDPKDKDKVEQHIGQLMPYMWKRIWF